VEVVGYLAHDGIDVEAALAEPVDADALQDPKHVGPFLLGGLRAVALPHDHRHHADLAVRDPAHVVFVVPRRDAGRLAKLALRHGCSLPRYVQVFARGASNCWLGWGRGDSSRTSSGHG